MSNQVFQSNGFASVSYDAPASNDHTSTLIDLRYRDFAYITFDLAGAINRFNKVDSLALRLHGCAAKPRYGSSTRFFIQAAAYASRIDLDTLTLNTSPQSYAAKTIFSDAEKPVETEYTWSEYDAITTDSIAVSLMLQYGMRLDSNRLIFHSPKSEYKPELIVSVSDTLATGALKNFSPTGGSIQIGNDNLFSFAFEQNVDEPSITPLSISSFKLQWRVHGTTSVSTIEVQTWDGDTPNYTVPAGTFHGDSIDWRAVATTNAEQVLESDWFTLSTVDAIPTAIASFPNGGAINASVANRFTWVHIISSGTLPTRSELERSTDGATWVEMADIVGGATECTVPAHTFGTGINYWRVRTYNADGVASAWSQTAQFICVGAPETPVVLIGSASPRPAITWQVEGQLAYQVEIEGVYTTGVCYGTGKQWTTPMYLPDGDYTARVRVQNEYGLWSGWGMAALGVRNTAGAAITLTAEAGTGVLLGWQTSGSYDFYLVYRDGTAIAKTNGRTYTDSTSIGAVSYQVRGCYKDSADYGLSGAVQANVNVESITVIDLERSRTVILPYSASAHRKTTRSFARDVRRVQLAGRKFPAIERGEHESRSINVSCAVSTAAERAALEALCGQLVAVKTPEGAMVTGCMDALDANDDGGFYTVYSFTVEQMDMEEEIDIDA